MKLTFVEKMKIGKMLREKPFSDINYYSFYDANNKKFKYNDIDILEYLLDFVYEALSKAEVINLNYLLKYIYSIKMFLAIIIDSEQTDLISQSYKNKLSALNLKYAKIRKNYPEELSDSIIAELKQIQNLLEYIKIEIDEQVAIEELEKENEENQYAKAIKKLNDEIKSLKEQNEKLQKRIANDAENKSEQAKIINNNNHKIRILEKQLSELQHNYERLNAEYINLTTNYEKITDESNIQSAKIVSLEDTINTQKEKLDFYETKEKIEVLANTIFKLIRYNQMSALDILEECNKKGFDTNIDEVKKALIYLESKVKITNDKRITIPKLYKVESAKLKSNMELVLEPKTEGYLDILVISDLHVKKVDLAVSQEFNKIYEYCAKEGINLILNLGDFFGITHLISELDEYERILADFVENLPTDENIIHAILGGNHDEYASIGGFNTLEKLCSLKEGLLFLGHNRANVVFDEQSKNHFAIHHLNRKIETDFINLFPETKAYVNLIGHTHISKFDLLNHNIFVPSLTKDRMSNGALRARIYFDRENNIDYMLFTLLKNEDFGLVPVTEIPYQRILKNKLN